MLRYVTRYGDLWKPADELHAMQLVLNEKNAEFFEASGLQQAKEVLCPLIERTDVVLDLGCGIGRVARYVAECCRVLWAVDAARERARKRAAGGRPAFSPRPRTLHSPSEVLSGLTREIRDLCPLRRGRA